MEIVSILEMRKRGDFLSWKWRFSSDKALGGTGLEGRPMEIRVVCIRPLLIEERTCENRKKKSINDDDE